VKDILSTLPNQHLNLVSLIGLFYFFPPPFAASAAFFLVFKKLTDL